MIGCNLNTLKSKEVLEYCYPKAETAQAVPTKASSPGVLRQSAMSAQIGSSSVADGPKTASSSALPSAQATSPSIADSTNPASASASPRLSKGQKKKAKAKAKKEAAKETGEGSDGTVLTVAAFRGLVARPTCSFCTLWLAVAILSVCLAIYIVGVI